MGVSSSGGVPVSSGAGSTGFTAGVAPTTSAGGALETSDVDAIMVGHLTTTPVGFHGTAATAQRAGAAQAAVAGTASTNVTPFGYTTAAQADGIVTLLNEIRTALVAKGFIKGSA